MNTIKNINGWRAVEIAKVYLLNYGKIQLLKDKSGKFDFIAFKINDLNKRIAIEIKATKYSKSEIINTYKDHRKHISHKEKIPVLIMYINYDNEKGFFEIFKGGKKSPLQILTISTINENLDELLNL